MMRDANYKDIIKLSRMGIDHEIADIFTIGMDRVTKTLIRFTVTPLRQEIDNQLNSGRRIRYQGMCDSTRYHYPPVT